MAPEILIPTNGFKGTRQSIAYGVWLAKMLGWKIVLFGVNERLSPGAIDEPHHPLEEFFEYATMVFQQQGVEYRLEVENGSAEAVIPPRANRSEAIVVLGRLGRPLIRHLVSGRSIRHFIEGIKQPVLYVPEAKLPVKRILICIGGLGYEAAVEDLAFQIARKCHAGITLLHVVPPVEFDYPTAKALQENWQTPDQTDTPMGENLRKALAVAKNAGLSVTVKGRLGNVVEEIFAEAKEGEYDLICMGSSYSGKSLRKLYSPNVTSEVAGSINIPVLTTRYQGE